MKKFYLILDLIRYNRPIGVYLLAWPCFIALAISGADFFAYLKFGFGAFAMRSLGCIINDYFDKDFDKFVARTKNRPLASAKLKTKDLVLPVFLLSCFGFLIFLSLNFKAQLLCFAAFLMMIIYPLLKRWTNLPQLFLGFTFNIGFLIVLVNYSNVFDIYWILIYFALVLWTVIYDTFYAFCDLSDDELIGVKSSAILFKKHPREILMLLNALIVLLFAIYSFVKNEVCLNIFFILGFFYIGYFILKTDYKKPEDCIFAFKKLHLWGFLLFLYFLLVNNLLTL